VTNVVDHRPGKRKAKAFTVTLFFIKTILEEHEARFFSKFRNNLRTNSASASKKLKLPGLY